MNRIVWQYKSKSQYNINSKLTAVIKMSFQMTLESSSSLGLHVILRRDSGREFQMVGPETQNALSPNLVLVLGTSIFAEM